MGREGESRTLGVQTCFYGIFVVGVGGVFECFAEALGCYVFCLREFLHLCRLVCACCEGMGSRVIGQLRFVGLATWSDSVKR